MLGKINSRICLMLNVYKSFHQTVKCGQQRNHILQDLTGPVKPKTSFQLVFNNQNPVCKKTGISIPI